LEALLLLLLLLHRKFRKKNCPVPSSVVALLHIWSRFDHALSHEEKT